MSVCLGCDFAWIGCCAGLDLGFFRSKNHKKLLFKPRNSCFFSNTGDQQHQWDIPWHVAFIRGPQHRMGDTVSPDLGISIEVLVALLDLLVRSQVERDRST
jgi:hypothetical protein